MPCPAGALDQAQAFAKLATFVTENFHGSTERLTPVHLPDPACDLTRPARSHEMLLGAEDVGTGNPGMLGGSKNSVALIEATLKRLGVPESRIQALKGDTATRKALFKALDSMRFDLNCTDKVLLYFTAVTTDTHRLSQLVYSDTDARDWIAEGADRNPTLGALSEASPFLLFNLTKERPNDLLSADVLSDLLGHESGDVVFVRVAKLHPARLFRLSDAALIPYTPRHDIAHAHDPWPDRYGRPQPADRGAGMSGDGETMAVYLAQARDYADLVGGQGPDPELDGFLAVLPDAAAILDLGCGPGHAAAAMRDRGFRVIAEDASPEMARVARELFDLDVRIAEFADLADVDAFEGVWANFSLLHAPKADMPEHLAAIRRALRPGGVLSLGLKVGNGEARDRLGRFYAYYSDTEITGMLQAAGFTVIDRAFGAGKGLEGSVAPWIVLRARA